MTQIRSLKLDCKNAPCCKADIDGYVVNKSATNRHVVNEKRQKEDQQDDDDGSDEIPLVVLPDDEL